MECPICSSRMRRAFSAIVLNKHHAQYNYCDVCGFLNIENPFWLEEAYTDAIAQTDTGLVSRNVQFSSKIASILYFLFGERGSGQYVDAAGGYGMLVRLLRDHGIDFYWSDKYCDNLFAKGFEACVAKSSPIGYTAIEVMEHLQQPFDFVSSIFDQSGVEILAFTTELFTGSPPKPESWWYYALETGQHISFFQRQTLAFMANKLQLHFYSAGGLHLFTVKPINPLLYRLCSSKLSYISSFFVKRALGSKAMSDHELMVRRLVC